MWTSGELSIIFNEKVVYTNKAMLVKLARHRLQFMHRRSYQLLIKIRIPYRTKFRRTKCFVGQNFRHQAEISTLLSEEFLSDKVLIVT